MPPDFLLTKTPEKPIMKTESDRRFIRSEGSPMQYLHMRFPEGKTKAVTLSYDDGVKQDWYCWLPTAHPQ